MSDEQVRIDLTANDKASKTIDAVADDVEQLEKSDPEIEITADDKASDELADVQAAAEQLDKTDPEVKATADVAAAKADLASVSDDVAALDRADAEIVLRAKVDAAKADLSALQAELKATQEQAENTNQQLDRTTGGGDAGNLRGNAIADLTGPLGEASGAASDFAGVFDGLGDIAAEAATKLGASSETAARVGGALGTLGVAVAAGAALWSVWSSKQDAAKKKAEESKKAFDDLNDAIDENNRKAAAKSFLEAIGDDAVTAARELGLTNAQLVAFVRGTGNAGESVATMQAQIATLDAKIADVTGHTAEQVAQMQLEKRALEEQIAPLVAAQAAYADANVARQATVDLEADIAAALGVTGRELGDYTRSQETVKRAIENSQRATKDYGDELDDTKRGTNEAKTASERWAEQLEENRRKVAALDSALAAMRGQLDLEQALLTFQTNFETALGKVAEGTALTSQDILDLKGDVLNVAEFLKLNPMQVRAILDAVEQGDIMGVLGLVQGELDKQENWVTVHSKLDRPGQIVGGGTAGGGGPRAFSTAPEIGVVNMTLPAGWRGDPVRTAHAQRRRSGRYFARG